MAEKRPLAQASRSGQRGAAEQRTDAGFGDCLVVWSFGGGDFRGERSHPVIRGGVVCVCVWARGEPRCPLKRVVLLVGLDVVLETGENVHPENWHEILGKCMGNIELGDLQDAAAQGFARRPFAIDEDTVAVENQAGEAAGRRLGSLRLSSLRLSSLQRAFLRQLWLPNVDDCRFGHGGARVDRVQAREVELEGRSDPL